MKVKHLIIDANTISDKINSKEEIKNILYELADLIKMRILLKPQVIEGTVRPGITGIVIVEESHIAIHTFTITNSINIDVFSCKEFDPDKVIDYLKNKLEMEDIKVSIIQREI